MHRPAVALFALLGSVALLAPAAARAENGDEKEPDYARTGPYVALSGTLGIYTRVEEDYEDPLEELSRDIYQQVLPLGQQPRDEPCDNPLSIRPVMATTVDLGDEVALRTLCSIGEQGGSPVDLDYVLGLNGQIGYRLHRFVAVEAEFEWLPERDIELPAVAEFGTIESWSAGANVKGFLATGRVQPFLLAGAAYMHVDAPVVDEISVLVEADQATVTGAVFQDDAGSVAARFGGGFDLYLTEHLVGTLKLSYVLTFGEVADLVDADYLSFGWGFGYRF